MELVKQIRRMHRAGVEHNDLDATNIIRYMDHWWIIDFEHARRVDSKSSELMDEASPEVDQLVHHIAYHGYWRRAVRGP